MVMMHSICRWFGLDTVLCVVAIQLFLSTNRDVIDVFSMVGLCCAVSLVYILDRFVDLMTDQSDCNGRHLVYQQRAMLVFGSMIGLGGVAFMYWLSLDGMMQQILVGCSVVFVVHLLLLRFGWYSWFKDMVVSVIFAMVMMAGYMDLVYIGILIGLFTFYNFVQGFV